MDRRVTVLLQRHQKVVKVPGLPDDQQDKNEIGLAGVIRSVATGNFSRRVLGITKVDLVLASLAFRAVNTIVNTVKGITGVYPAVQTHTEFGDGTMTSNPVTKEEMDRAKAAFAADSSHTMEYYLMNDPLLEDKLHKRGGMALLMLQAHIDENPKAEIVALGAHGAGICEPLCGFLTDVEAKEIPGFAPGDFALITIVQTAKPAWRLDGRIRYFHVEDVEGKDVVKVIEVTP